MRHWKIGQSLATASRVLALIEKGLAVAGAAVLLGILVYITGNVIGRPLGFPIPYTVEVTAYMLVVMVFLVGAHTLRKGQHIKVELLTRRLSPRVQALLLVVTNLLAFIIAVVIVISCWQLAINSYSYNVCSNTVLRAPLYLPQLLLAIGLSVFTIESAVVTIRSVLHKET